MGRIGLCGREGLGHGDGCGRRGGGGVRCLSSMGLLASSTHPGSSLAFIETERVVD